MDENKNMTDEEAQEILRQFSESKSNVHTFLTNIIKADSTIKTGNLDKEELGMPKLPLRTDLELASFCKKVWNDQAFGEFFEEQGEILTSSSLSKEGLLVKLSVTNKRELADVTPPKKENKGWFRKKDES